KDVIEKIEQEKEQKARKQAFADAISPVAAELLPITEALEKAGEETRLTSAEVLHALGMLQLARANGTKLPPWEPSNLKRALTPMHPTYVDIARNLAEKRKQRDEYKILVENLQKQIELQEGMNTEYLRLVALDAALEDPEKYTERGYDEKT